MYVLRKKFFVFNSYQADFLFILYKNYCKNFLRKSHDTDIRNSGFNSDALSRLLRNSEIPRINGDENVDVLSYKKFAPEKNQNSNSGSWQNRLSQILSQRSDSSESGLNLNRNFKLSIQKVFSNRKIKELFRQFLKVSPRTMLLLFKNQKVNKIFQHLSRVAVFAALRGADASCSTFITISIGKNEALFRSTTFKRNYFALSDSRKIRRRSNWPSLIG